MNDQAKPASRPRRRFVRFSVRGMIVLVLVVGGWLGWLVRSARVQREAVTAISKNGVVRYDWEWPNGNAIRAKPWAPRWLVEAVGVDYFGNVALVMLAADVPDDVFTHVGQLCKVRELIITRSSAMTDRRLAPLRGLTSLLELNLFESDVTDAGMAYLEALVSLKKLNMNYAHVTDAGLVHLEGLTNLSELSLVPRILTDTELAQADERESTESSVYRVQITDAGLVHLSRLSSLSKLNLMGTRVTNGGLQHLKGLRKLSYLDLRETRVTDAGVKDLQQALPNLVIER